MGLDVRGHLNASLIHMSNEESGTTQTHAAYTRICSGWLLLTGFVLVGRALEERAKLRASADMVAMQVSVFKVVRTSRNKK